MELQGRIRMSAEAVQASVAFAAWHTPLRDKLADRRQMVSNAIEIKAGMELRIQIHTTLAWSNRFQIVLA